MRLSLTLYLSIFVRDLDVEDDGRSVSPHRPRTLRRTQGICVSFDSQRACIASGFLKESLHTAITETVQNIRSICVDELN